MPATMAPGSPSRRRASTKSICSSRSTTRHRWVTSRTCSRSPFPVLVGRLLNPNCVDDRTCKTCTGAGDCSASARARTATPPATAAPASASSQATQGRRASVLDHPEHEARVPARPRHAHRHRHLVARRRRLAGRLRRRRATTRRTRTTRATSSTAPSATTPTARRSTTRSRSTATAATSSRGSRASDPKNAGKTPPNVTPYSDGQETQLDTDFESLVQGVQQHGCGLEAQLESWYRFLVQPDPYDTHRSSTSDNPPKASLARRRRDAPQDASRLPPARLARRDHPAHGRRRLVERSALARRLRLDGAHATASPAVPAAASVRAARASATSPTTSTTRRHGARTTRTARRARSRAASSPSRERPSAHDPNCNACAGGTTTCPQKGWYTPASSSRCRSPRPTASTFATRTVRCARATASTRSSTSSATSTGSARATVPDRDQRVARSRRVLRRRSATARTRSSRQDLPDGSDTSPGALCDLKAGSRTPDLVFYALIGGVPNVARRGSRTATSSSTSSPADWTKIVGKDPGALHLRRHRPAHDRVDRAARRASRRRARRTTSEAIRQRSRVEHAHVERAAIDLQYACTFDLPTPKDCTAAQNASACDCTGTAATAADGPPLCSTADAHDADHGQGVPDDPRAPRREGSRRASRRRVALREGRDERRRPRRRSVTTPRCKRSSTA